MYNIFFKLLGVLLFIASLSMIFSTYYYSNFDIVIFILQILTITVLILPVVIYYFKMSRISEKIGTLRMLGIIFHVLSILLIISAAIFPAIICTNGINCRPQDGIQITWFLFGIPAIISYILETIFLIIFGLKKINGSAK